MSLRTTYTYNQLVLINNSSSEFKLERRRKKPIQLRYALCSFEMKTYKSFQKVNKHTFLDLLKSKN